MKKLGLRAPAWVGVACVPKVQDGARVVADREPEVWVVSG